jgi:hypothetical protein
MGVGAERGQPFVETEVLDREAELDRPHAEAHEQMTLPHPGRALQQDDLGVPDPGAGRQRLDPGALDRRLEGEIEVLERLARRDFEVFSIVLMRRSSRPDRSASSRRSRNTWAASSLCTASASRPSSASTA